MSKNITRYLGTKLTEAQRFTYLGEPFRIDPYLPGPKLIDAVYLAQVLDRPLLLKGEPGCGKTRLAEAVAWELFGANYPAYYIEWHVKSTSRAQDGLYTIDNLQRLRDANLRQNNIDVGITLPPGEIKGRYLELGPLGRAFQLTKSMAADPLPPPIVLIDEIDKADIDFPNDLLLELDKMEFTIPEATDGHGHPVTIKANKDKKPLIIITSNDEKSLPAAFLRRCLFHYIDFPVSDDLRKIVQAKWPGLDSSLIGRTTDKFIELRKAIKDAGTASKNITTSELLDWVTLIENHVAGGQLPPDLDSIPFAGSLAKDNETINIFLNYKNPDK